MKRLFLWFCFGLLLALPAAADQVELVDGSLIKGRILAVETGKIRVQTSFVGTVTIALESVVSFATDEAVHVGVAGSPVVVSRVSSTEAGVAIDGESVRLAAKPSQVTALWRQGGESPAQRVAREAAEKRRRKWAYEASGTITGRMGVRDKLNATVGLKATLASSRDRLILAMSAERAEDQGIPTANRESASVDYSAFYSPDRGWYVRSLAETDEIKALDFRSTTAAGISRKLIRRSNLDLEFRSGASFLVENFSNGQRFDSPGLDFTLLNTCTLGHSKLTTTLAYVPTFQSFGNYRMRHESSLEVPLNVSLWKLKLGLTNDYQSQPPGAVEKFDTTYFTSLLLNWK